MPKRKIPSSARASPNGKSKPRPNVNPNRKAKTAATMMRRTTPKQFGRFKELPLEIRCMIWKLALPEGRVIEVLWNEEKGRFYTDAIQPVTLQVCRDSRQETKRIFDSFELKMDGQMSRLTMECLPKEELVCYASSPAFRTYIDWPRDTLYFSSHISPTAIIHLIETLRKHPHIENKLKSIALPRPSHPLSQNMGNNGFYQVALASIIALTSVETIELAFEEEGEGCQTNGHSCNLSSYSCNLSTCHRRAIGVAIDNSLPSWNPTKINSHVIKIVFDEMRRRNYLQDYGMSEDTKPHIPTFVCVNVSREKAMRHRSGPYGMKRKKW